MRKGDMINKSKPAKPPVIEEEKKQHELSSGNHTVRFNVNDHDQEIDDAYWL